MNIGKSNLSISVILPVYNTEKYIKEAIESILNQSFSDFEFIIIDDGSTDKTSDIIKSIKDNRIVLLQNTINLGNFPSRNKGIRLAKGRYIAVMDGDDTAFPNRLQIQYDYMEKHPEVLAVGSESIIIPTNRKRKTPISYEEISTSLLDNSYVLHPSLFIRTEVIKGLNGYNEKYRYAADYDLICRLSINGIIECLPNVLMAYRHHSEQITSQCRSAQISFANEIQLNYIVAFVNKFRSEKQAPIEIPEVSFPQIGIAIGYYTYAKYSGNKKYEDFANSIIGLVYNTISKSTPICLYKGICGVGCGLVYLIRNRFLDGVEDIVLEDIDIEVVNAINNLSNKENINDQLFYVHYRNIQNRINDYSAFL